MRKQIFSIVGARPQFIKLAPLSKALREYHDETIIHTGQHYDVAMSEAIFHDLNIPRPDYNLNIGAGTHAEQVGKMMIDLETMFLSGKPDLVLVFGDTNSTMAGALAASKLLIPTIHIEAGLRSFNRTMPEEVNRVVADHVSTLLFAPTENAFTNLHFEGLIRRTTVTGDIMVDTLKQNLPIALLKSNIINDLHIISERYNLLTLHRPSNVDDPFILSHILEEVAKIKGHTIFPVHPRTQKILRHIAHGFSRNIEFISPVGYLDFLKLENNAKRIITDSGGIQKEAYLLEKPCITLRTETEWPETVYDGWNLLINPSASHFWDEIELFEPTGEQRNIFGSDVAEKMVTIINKL
jgi:UDP-N-acetylglucosamine 2-epimerase